MRKSEHKPLSFSTTMRNPERIAHFVSCIESFEGQILTTNVIMSIVKKIIEEKLYKPMYIDRNSLLKSIYDDKNASFTAEQIEEIIKESPQKHKEAGFDRGWESRFDTWYKICKEFGFIYYEKDKKIEISESGKLLCNAYFDNADDTASSVDINEKVQNVFLNALMKYQTNNPFRKNANENAPIPLLLNVLKLLKNDKDENGAGIYRKELPFLTCWNNSSHSELYKFIKSFRKKYGYNASDEIVYTECLKLLQSENTTRFKMVQIMKEGVDDLIRKLRITGIFSLRGMGRFIDINELESTKVNYIINNYSDYKTFSKKYDFYKYMGKIDVNIIAHKEISIERIDDIRAKAIVEISKKYSMEEIAHELQILDKGSSSKDEYFRLIDAPTRLEFLVSLALTKKYPGYTVRPNYSIDDEGNPTFTAKGGVADIEVYADDFKTLVEVTLIRNSQQAVVEIPAITRHLEKEQSETKKLLFAIFVAPNVHYDTRYMCGYTQYSKKLNIYPYTIKDFIDKLKQNDSLKKFLYDISI